jgi:hypothetical protein
MGSEERQKRRGTLDDLPSYVFRGDRNYHRGAVGLSLDGKEAQTADIQNPADHVLRKEPGKTSIYSSFTARLSVAERFSELRWIVKAEVAALQKLEAEGVIRLLLPSDAYDLLKRSGRRLANEAGPTRDYMLRNAEVLVEGQIPARVIEGVKQKRRRV